MGVFLIILGLVLFVSLVVVHEFGHLLAARRNDVDVEEFGIGFPPTAWKRKLKSGLLFTINWLPLGGFVRLKGEHDADTEKGSYGAASLWAKTQIMVAGVLVNLAVAILMFTLLALIGMPKLIDGQFTVPSDTTVTKNEVLVGGVEDDSPASQAGLQQRDQLISIGTSLDNAQQITSAKSLPEATSEFAGQKVQITYERGGNTQVSTTTLRTAEEVEKSKSTDDPKGYLGIVPAEYTLQRSTWSAPIVGVGVTAQLGQATFKGLGTVIAGLFTGQASKSSEQLCGPVCIVSLMVDGSQLGIQFVLMIIAVISLTLAIMNALPIPALDGGRLFVTYLYRILGKKLTPKAEELIHGIGFAALMVLFVLITFLDIKRF
jgi:regulator of sigma E protease